MNCARKLFVVLTLVSTTILVTTGCARNTGTVCKDGQCYAPGYEP